MKPVAWMVAASAAGWCLVTVGAGDRANPEAVWGMVGPLLSAVTSWVAYTRAHASAPGRLMNVMIAALALKMLFFGVYVAVMIRGLGLRPAPFVVSFAGYFIALQAIEAFSLRRLLMDDLRSPGSERT